MVLLAQAGLGRGLPPAAVAADTTPTITEFPPPAAGGSPIGIAAGPDGNLWFAGGGYIGRITPGGAITEFPLPSANSSTSYISTSYIAAGPDGNLWFTETDGISIDRIGRITPAGAITEFPLPADSDPMAIAAGPDGNLWFTEAGGISIDRIAHIGRITPAGAIVEFALPTGATPGDIAAGPDGNLWFTEFGSTLYPGDHIGRITPAGAITEFALPIIASHPSFITAGPDGNLWFTQATFDAYPNDRIGRITPAGAITEFPPLAAYAEPWGIAAGPDGNLWFTEYDGDRIGRITPAGAISEFPVPTAFSKPAGIAAGPDGNLWFTEWNGGKIGRITTGTAPAAPTITGLSPASARVGGPGFTLTVTGSNFVSGATVQWGGTTKQPTSLTTTRITVQIAAGDIATNSSVGVAVVNPGGATSEAAAFRVGTATVQCGGAHFQFPTMGNVGWLYHDPRSQWDGPPNLTYSHIDTDADGHPTIHAGIDFFPSATDNHVWPLAAGVLERIDPGGTSGNIWYSLGGSGEGVTTYFQGVDLDPVIKGLYNSQHYANVDPFTPIGTVVTVNNVPQHVHISFSSAPPGPYQHYDDRNVSETQDPSWLFAAKLSEPLGEQYRAYLETPGTPGTSTRIANPEQVPVNDAGTAVLLPSEWGSSWPNPFDGTKLRNPYRRDGSWDPSMTGDKFCYTTGAGPISARVTDVTTPMTTGSRTSGIVWLDAVSLGLQQLLHIVVGPVYSDVDVTLTRPDGSAVSPTDPGVQYSKTGNFVEYTIQGAQTGAWTYTVVANQLDTGGESVHITVDVSNGGPGVADLTGPATTASMSPGPAPGQVTVTLQAADDPGGSGVQSITFGTRGTDTRPMTTVPGSSASLTVSAIGATTVYYFATDVVGNQEVLRSLDVQVGPADTAPPTTIATPSPAPDAAGWNNGDVAVTLAATDNPGGSGVEQITYSASGAQAIPSTTASGASVTLPAITVEGRTTITYYATDNAGNAETPKTLTVKVDKTKPTTTPAPSPTPNAANWNNADVTVTLNATDNADGSGVQSITYSASGAQPIPATTIVGATARLPAVTTDGVTTITYYATDNAGNQEVPKTLTVKLDKTPPTVTCASPDGQWHATDVSLACTASDSTSGLASADDANFSLSTSVPTGSETANAATNSHQVCDVARNCAAAGPIAGNKVDKKPPTITVTAPTDAKPYLLHQAVAVDYACADGGSGVATCAGPVASGGALDTTSVGAKTFAVSAADKVGNAASQSVPYTVTYTVCALYDQTKAVNSGATVAIKLQLCDAQAANASASAVVVTAVSIKGPDGATLPPVAAGDANPGNAFRYDATLGGTGGYIYNLKTDGLAPGTYTLSFAVAGDPATHTTQFVIK